MGIEDFRYNKINDQYSLSFSQWLDLGSLEEIVLYDKHDLKNNLTGDLAKYDYRFDLCRARIAFASHDTGHPHGDITCAIKPVDSTGTAMPCPFSAWIF